MLSRMKKVTISQNAPAEKEPAKGKFAVMPKNVSQVAIDQTIF